MVSLSDRIATLARTATELDERLTKAMRSRGVDGDGDGVFNEGVTPPAKGGKRMPPKRPQKAQQSASEQAPSQPPPKARRARGGPQKPATQAAPEQAEGMREEA
jgi:hypothetical protein